MFLEVFNHVSDLVCQQRNAIRTRNKCLIPTPDCISSISYQALLNADLVAAATLALLQQSKRCSTTDITCAWLVNLDVWLLSQGPAGLCVACGGAETTSNCLAAAYFALLVIPHRHLGVYMIEQQSGLD